MAGKENNRHNRCYNIDANKLAETICCDLVYIDPPYNSRQYCDAYHLLENVARWEKPQVFGVARKMDRSKSKSQYCTKGATKGNDRSNAKIADEDIYRILSFKGKVKVFSEDYKAFTTGKSDISDNQERLFLCICD